MNVSDVYQLVQSLGALSSIASAYLAFRQQGKEIGPHELDHMLAEAEVIRQEPISDDVLRAAMRIPDSIFDGLKSRAEKAEKNYVKIIRSPNTRGIELQEMYEKAQEEVCEVLKAMKRHNDDELPDDDWLKKLWDSFRCLEYA